MARYAEHHKPATRRRILDTAAHRMKTDGLAGSGVATLMADAGLTNGAFYVHFDSKAELVATVVAEELDAQRATAAALPHDPAGLAVLVAQYLSAEHRDHPGAGCPSAALVEEIARGGAEARQAYTRGMVDFVDVIAGFLPPGEHEARRVQVLAAFAGMVGTLQLARALTDRALSAALLARGVENALRVLGAAGPSHLDTTPEAPASPTGSERT